MFDTRRRDDEASRRTAGSLALTVLTVVTCGGTIVLGGAMTVADRVPEPVDNTEMLAIEVQDLDLGSPPPAPKAPAAPAAAAAKPPDVPTEPVPLSTPPPENAPVVATAPPGTPEGPPGPPGGPPGIGTGPGSGPGEGFGKGTGDGPVTLHHTEVEVRKRVAPVYPEAARSMNLGEQACRAVVTIDLDGRPEAIDLSGCPVLFQASARDAIDQWRWKPAQVGGEAVRARFTITVKYVLN